jgi:hypothetical protein
LTGVGHARVAKAKNKPEAVGLAGNYCSPTPCQPCRNEDVSPHSAEDPAAPCPAGPAEPAQPGPDGAVDLALAESLRAATAAGEWSLVAELARELGERRRARTAPDVASLETARARKSK